MKKRHTLLPPSLNGLRVFESAARHLSFTLAAEELNVTQSAVSRQIRQLEEKMGFQLFIRHHRALDLTEQGKEIALILTRQYSELNHTIRQLQAKESHTLRIKVVMSFAVRWLIPRLHSFKARYPTLDINLESNMGYSSEELKLENDDYDIAIYNVQHEPKSHFPLHFLRREYLAPVYSELLAPQHTPMTVEDILHYPRLHPSPEQSDWQVWLSRNGLDQHINQNGITFNTLDMALTSCFSGQGVTITDLMLVVNELRQGYLRLPEDATIVTNSSWEYYYRIGLESDAVTSFITWMEEELQSDHAVLTAMAHEHGWQVLE
ncbi:LysR family transcriptional regulator [Photobacterium aquae]|uniref:LysR family transcriptional regulator n=1 Tax=Photobacterium aquae TaxID=1195763 RepID=A0A0J1H0L0_9GAMM|nr:LysR substrate-binding domain-containing protein [Photobacterium aquae]KLV05378.1 LysR family transcriptional regulator [Photobacterium aquae]